MSDLSFYSTVFSAHFGSSLKIQKITPVAGGCINSTNRVDTNEGSFFMKVNSKDQEDLFVKEAKGLYLLQKKSDLCIPKEYCSGIANNNAYLILEWIEKGHQTSEFWLEFGRRLAHQHKQSSNQFGLDHNNHIGRLPQSNTNHDTWVDFFIRERLEPQIMLAGKANLINTSIHRQFELLYSRLNQLVPIESPSLLHGDLWSGNFLCGPESLPYVFDPAIYYGHRETELSFTRMFGGFDHTFYQAYQETFELQPGFEDRIELHNLYPLLVHLNLFGSSYLSGILSTLKKYA